MPYRYSLTLALLLVACSRSSTPQRAPTGPQADSAQAVAAGKEARRHIGARTACLLITDSSGKERLRTDAERCAQRLLPFSTFKIANSLIGLETGHLEDAETVIAWSPEKYPPQAWWPEKWTGQEHTLRSAFRFSHVPYYRTLATHIGDEAMAKYVRQFGYGNQNISGNLDSFWLDGNIAISADEQVQFLRRFYEERLGVSSQSTAVVKDILVRDQAQDATLSAKTGTGVDEDGKALAWLVGYVERGEELHYFAFNIEAANAEEVNPGWRISAVEAVMAEFDLWPRS